MKKLPYVLVAALGLLCGMIAGFRLGKSGHDRIDRFQTILFENCIAGTCFPRPSSELSIAELLTIWERMVCAQRQIQKANDEESNLAKLATVWEGPEVSAQILAPVMVGILQSKGVTFLEYFQIQAALAVRARGATNDSRFGSFLFQSEDIHNITRGALGNFGIETVPSISDKEWELMREPLAEFLGSKYKYISEIDLSLLHDIVIFSARHKVVRRQR